MKPIILARLNETLAARHPITYAKNLADGREFLLPDAAAPDGLNDIGAAALVTGKTGTHQLGGEDWFIEARNPAPRLILIGAVHIAQALVPLAEMMGFAVTLIDPRRGFGNQDRFPGSTISNQWPDEALETIGLDAATAIVALSHDPKLDDPALDRALHSDAFYIGALGSRKTHSARLDRLAALGHAPETLARIHGPVGLNIGAVTTPEIALSIITQIVARHRQA